MKKLRLWLAVFLCIVLITPCIDVIAVENQLEREEMNPGDEDFDDYDDYEDDELLDDTAYCCVVNSDITVTPAKKTIRKGKSFFIEIALADEIASEFLKEDQEELLKENIDSVIFRSSNSSVVSVNKKGKVKGKKKGSAIIKTTITFGNGSEKEYRTKVYVTKK